MAATLTEQRLSGNELAKKRRVRGLTAREIAEAMHVSRSRVSGLEAVSAVPSGTVRRYLDAIENAIARRLARLS